MKSNILTAIFLLLVCNQAMSQNCPAGIPSAGNPLCIPQDNENSPYYQRPLSSKPPPQHWQLTWGAVAMSAGGDGGVGVSVGKYSRFDAGNEAILQCELVSETACELVLSYHNQCAVIAWPSRDGDPVGGETIVRGGASIDVASNGALAACRSLHNGNDCEIVYSACTKPVLVQ
jgi:hypothetical protein